MATAPFQLCLHQSRQPLPPIHRRNALGGTDEDNGEMVYATTKAKAKCGGLSTPLPLRSR